MEFSEKSSSDVIVSHGVDLHIRLLSGHLFFMSFTFGGDDNVMQLCKSQFGEQLTEYQESGTKVLKAKMSWTQGVEWILIKYIYLLFD